MKAALDDTALLAGGVGASRRQPVAHAARSASQRNWTVRP